jgi:hypothetical protein
MPRAANHAVLIPVRAGGQALQTGSLRADAVRNPGACTTWRASSRVTWGGGEVGPGVVQPGGELVAERRWR